MEIRLRVEAVHRWYVHDWNTLDNKIRSSIVEGVSVFLSMFDVPAVARVFCPPAPEARRLRGPAEPRPADNEGHELPALAPAALSGDLPPLDALIEGGKRRGGMIGNRRTGASLDERARSRRQATVFVERGISRRGPNR